MRYLPLLLLPLLFAACADDSVVHVHGRLLDAADQPVHGYRVWLLAFPSDHDSEVFTDENGEYDVSVTLTGEPVIDFEVHIDGLDASEVALVQLHQRTGDFDVPDIRLWDAKIQHDVADGVQHVSWQAAELPDAPASYTLTIFQARTGEEGKLSWWQPGLKNTSYEVANEVLEDRFASLRVYAGASPYQCDRDLCVTLYSPYAQLTRGTQAPVSRGASCTAAADGGSEQPLLGQGGAPCPLTDGVTDEYRLGVCVGDSCTGSPHDVVVDLGQPTLVHEVLLRWLQIEGMSSLVSIEGSTDGEHFVTLKQVDEASVPFFGVIELDAAATLRKIRLVPVDGDIAALSELSVY